MTFARLLTCVGLLSVVSAPVAAQNYRDDPAGAAPYRSGQPPVLTPAPKADPNGGNKAAAANFRQWNGASGRPTILIFWSRSLSDDAASGFEDYFTQVIADLPAGILTSQVSGSRPTESGRDQRINRALSEALQGSFMTTFLDNGAEILDRNALIRKVSVGRSKVDRFDKQNLETMALENNVKYLVEIVPDRKPASPTRLTFLVKITYLPTSAVRAQFASDGSPPPGATRNVAGSYGFEKRTENTITVENIGAQIAYEVMGRIR